MAQKEKKKNKKFKINLFSHLKLHEISTLSNQRVYKFIVKCNFFYENKKK